MVPRGITISSQENTPVLVCAHLCVRLAHLCVRVHPYRMHARTPVCTLCKTVRYD